MTKQILKTFSASPDIIAAIVLAMLPWFIHESDFLELVRWAAILYLLGAALLYKYFSLSQSQK